MDNKKTTALQGNLFEIENEVTNPTAANEPQPVSAANEPQFVFAVAKGNIGVATPATGELIAQELASIPLRDIINEVRAETDEKKQKQLKEQHKFDIIGICPHYYRFRNDHRTAADAIPECCTFQTCVDVDDRQYGQQAIEGALRLNKQEGTMWHQKVLYIENSLRGGGKVHIWLRCPVGMTVAETQQAFCKALGIPCDESVQQKQSFILMTGDVVYQSDLWLKPLNPSQIEAHREAFRLRGMGIDGWPLEKTAAQPVAASPQEPITQQPTSITEPTPRSDYIFEAFWRTTGLDPQAINTDGKMHNSLKSLLSTGVVQLLTLSEMQGQLRHRAPDYWDCNDCQNLLRDFYSKYYDPARALTQYQRRILAQSQHLSDNNCQRMEKKEEQQQPTCDLLTLSEIYALPQPPRLNPQKMPRLVKSVTAHTPDVNLECVAQSCFPALEAHPIGFSAKYIDNRFRQLRAANIAVAETGIGKACIDLPVKHIMADIEATTQQERKKEREYHQKFTIRNSNQDKPKRQKYRIRNLMANLTPAALVLRTEDNEGAPLFCKMNEVEQWDKIENAAGSKNQFTIMKLNDDEGNQFGAERAGTQSVTAATSLFLNWCASTTPSKLIRYFRNVVTDGPISRFTLATIPDPGIGADCPVFGDYDEKYDALLKPFIDNLNAATGQIECPQACRMIKRLKAECDEFAIASGDRVFDNLTHRALVHVFRKAICIYAANGMKWEKNIETFCRWSLHYDLFLKLLYFADFIRQADQDTQFSKHGPRNMLELLPDEFTAGELSDVRFLQGKDREGTANQIYQWVHRGLVLHLTADKYKKVPKKR